ncbi:MAG: hypothetical protein MUF87_15555 [Anaerolineae bacterium]|nr:hypothetical protein [Anaerolineae bacterium]
MTPPAATPVVSAASFDCVIHTAIDYDSGKRFGAWSAILTFDDTTIELSGTEPKTSEYHLALMAVHQAFKRLPEQGSIVVYTPNELVQNGATQWIKGWRNKGWKNSKGETIAHCELWQALDPILQARTIRWNWEAGSSPAADQLAIHARQQAIP